MHAVSNPAGHFESLSIVWSLHASLNTCKATTFTYFPITSRWVYLKRVLPYKRLLRLAFFLERFCFTIRYIPGKQTYYPECNPFWKCINDRWIWYYISQQYAGWRYQDSCRYFSTKHQCSNCLMHCRQTRKEKYTYITLFGMTSHFIMVYNPEVLFV